ncbi:metallophosphoesterase family protein [Lunatimonas lonarensis]|nr:metallophosphoesterase [Lunatimonas lonarensis]
MRIRSISLKKYMYATAVCVLLSLGFGCNEPEKYRTVRFGVFTDAHLSLMHDSEYRLDTFIDEMIQEKPDFIIELGDFFPPDEKFAHFYGIWNKYDGEKYHVIGNHETDGGFSLVDVLKSRKMENSYYSFQKSGFHFIVLDGNDQKSPDTKPYFRYIGNDQIEWLKEDLKESSLPVVVFSHQELFCPEGEEGMGVENYRQIQEIFEAHNVSRPDGRVIACFNGHTHFDHVENVNGIWYIQINSMSYNWLGGEFTYNRFTDDIDSEFPFVKYTAPFKDPLFATVEISTQGYIKIVGRQSEWIVPDPWELGYPDRFKKYMSPKISDRYLEF